MLLFNQPSAERQEVKCVSLRCPWRVAPVRQITEIDNHQLVTVNHQARQAPALFFVIGPQRLCLHEASVLQYLSIVQVPIREIPNISEISELAWNTKEIVSTIIATSY